MNIDRFLGQTLTEDVKQELNTYHESVRIVRPGMILTMDHIPYRLNVYVNESGTITSMNYG